MKKYFSRESGQLGVPQAIIIGACILAIVIGGVMMITGSRAEQNGQVGNVAAIPKPMTAEDIIQAHIDLAVNDYGIDADELQSCIEGGEVESYIQDELVYARDERGIRGTPNSVIIAPNGNQHVSIPGFIGEYRALEEIANMMIENGSFAIPEGSQITEVDPLELRSTDFVYGNPDAPVKIVEFSDLSCGFCGRFHPVMERLVDENPDTIAWIYRHLPYQSLGFEKAVIAQCVGEIGGNDSFWGYMHDAFQL